MKIKKTYQEFIKESSEFIDEKTMRDIFIDLIDMDFSFRPISNNITSKQNGKWYIDIRKTVESKYDYIENDSSSGVSNLEPMKLDITKVLDIYKMLKKH